MKIELYHSLSCPFSSKVRNFIRENDLKPQIDYHDIENEHNLKKLLEYTGDEQVPCLVVDSNPILESEVIINWLKDHLIRQAA